MELSEYQERAMTTCVGNSRNVEYMLLNLIGEVGELAEKFMPNAKEYYLRQMLGDMVVTGQIAGKYAKAIQNGETKVLAPIEATTIIAEGNLDEIAKKLGNVVWQTAGLCEMLYITLEDVAIMNLLNLAECNVPCTTNESGVQNNVENLFGMINKNSLMESVKRVHKAREGKKHYKSKIKQNKDE